MNEIFSLLSENLIVAAKVALPFLLILLLSGLLIGLVQAATQINEPATPFIVKLLAVGALLWVMGNWSVNLLSEALSNNVKHISIYKNVTNKQKSMPVEKTPPSAVESNKP